MYSILLYRKLNKSILWYIISYHWLLEPFADMPNTIANPIGTKAAS